MEKKAKEVLKSSSNDGYEELADTVEDAEAQSGSNSEVVDHSTTQVASKPKKEYKIITHDELPQGINLEAKSTSTEK